MYLHLLSEKDLRFRIKEGWAEVFFKNYPDFVIGRRMLELKGNIDHFDEAWEAITKEIGPIMPADLVEDQFMKVFHGVAYLSEGFSCCECPNCLKELGKDDFKIKEGRRGKYLYCPHCNKKIKVTIWTEMPNRDNR